MNNYIPQTIFIWRSLAYVAFTVAGLAFIMVLVAYAKV